MADTGRKFVCDRCLQGANVVVEDGGDAEDLRRFKKQKTVLLKNQKAAIFKNRKAVM